MTRCFDATAHKEIVEMPDRQVGRLRGFLQQGGWRLSKRAREQELAALTDADAERVEALYALCFDRPGPQTSEPRAPDADTGDRS